MSHQECIFKKNDKIRLSIEDLSQRGEGIGRLDGMVFFVKNAIPGDVIIAGITKIKKTYGYARLITIESSSPDRIHPPCEVAGLCGGCQMMQMAYPAQLSYKMHCVQDCLVRIGGFSKEEISSVMLPIIGMEDPFSYRNKAQIPIGVGANQEPVMGYYAPFSHRIIESQMCLIGQPEDNAICDSLKTFMKKYRILPYDEKVGSGILRHLVIRHGTNRHGEKEIMVTLVVHRSLTDLSGKMYENIQKELYLDELIKTFSKIPHIKSICLNENQSRGNAILGRRTIAVFGSSAIEDTLIIKDRDEVEKKLVFQISARSFYQVNSIQMKKLYDTALSFADLSGTEIVYDLYCGIGTITLAMATKARHVYGVEVVEDAICDAKENAKENQMNNATFFVGKAEELLPKIQEEALLEKPEVIVVDPPRKGCDIACLETILTLSPDRIVYVSCNPATLARDLRVLCDSMYTLKKVQPVDQFCHSGHVESVCLLTSV